MPTTDTPTPSTDNNGFSARWMLDGRARDGAATMPGDANASARAIDTDGDGVADTLSVRVDAERPSMAGRIGGWIARSIVTLLLVAALVAAATAATAYLQAQEELDRTTAMLEAERGAATEARAEATAASARVTELEGAALEAERDALQNENDVLRGMLFDEDRRTTSSR